jgi:hypothetical protein
MLAGFALTPPPEAAGNTNIGYVFQDWANKQTVGSLYVNEDAALASGYITNANIVDFNFSPGGYGNFTLADLVPGIQIPIDSFGNPTGSGAGPPLGAINAEGDRMVVGMGADWWIKEPYNYISVIGYDVYGTGVWFITPQPSAVPEPSAAVLAGIAVVFGLILRCVLPRRQLAGVRGRSQGKQ